MLRVKLGGLMLAECAGLPIGKEGPLVHVAAVVTDSLLGRPFFRPVRHMPRVVDGLLAVSLAVGLSSAFGVPVGGVLFALELVPDGMGGTMNYWTCTFAAIVGSSVLRALPILVPGPIVNLLPPVRFFELEDDALRKGMMLLIVTAPLGMLCGLLGALFINVQSAVATRIRKWLAGDSKSVVAIEGVQSSLTRKLSDIGESYREVVKRTTSAGSGGIAHRGIVICAAVTAVDSLVTWAVPLLRGAPQGALLWELISSNSTRWDVTSLSGTSAMPSLPHDGMFKGLGSTTLTTTMCLSCAFVWKFVISAFALSIPVPAGCVVPCYMMGALLGRAYVSALQLGWGELSAYHPEFALVGATAFCAAVCRSFSVVVAVSELIGVSRLMLPISLASLLAIAVAHAYSLGIFEEGAVSKSLPYLLKPRNMSQGHNTVETLMCRDVPLVPEHLGEDASAGRRFVRDILERHPGRSVAVVAGGPSNADAAPLIGTASRSSIEDFLEASAEASDEVAAAAAWFPRGLLDVAQQVPLTMSIREAHLALELHPERDLYVVSHGRVVGTVGFGELLKGQGSRG